MFRYFENLVNPFAPFEKGTPPGTYRAFMLQQLRSYRHVIPMILLTGMIVAIIESGLIYYAGRVVDLMEQSGPAQFWANNWVELTVALLFILFLRPLIIVVQRAYLEQTIAGNTQDLVRWRAHKHMLGQSLGFFQNDYAGRLSNRVMQLGTAVEDSFYLIFEGLWFFVAYIITAIVVLGGSDWRLAVPMLLFLAGFSAYTLWIARRVEVASEKWSNARSMVTGRIVDSYANIESVKLFAHNGREEAYAQSAMRRHRVRFQRFLRLMTELSFGLNVINGLLIAGVMIPAIALWHAGQVTLGEVATAAAFTIRLNGMTGWIMWVSINLFQHAGTIREGLESVSVDHAVVDTPDAKPLQVSRGEITFENLTQHYGKGSGGLEQVNLTIRAGEKVGLVGRSGAGKSSMVNMLLRFRDPETGRILIDGQDIAGVTQDSLRAQIGMVSQDSSLLHRSVRANILYGRPDATPEQIKQATRFAEADVFIDTLVDPNGNRGYDAQVGERGVKLSGGQRQRIALSRVILKDAPILVLDEATSALDSEVEAAIQSTLTKVMEGKTVIAIAHRLSTIAQMDRIIVLDKGQVAEEGTHADLLRREGLYAGFWARQSGGFLAVE